MARVTPKERLQARRQARAVAKFERKSARAASRLGFRMMSRVLNAYKNNRALEIRRIIEDEFRRVTPVMVDAMTIAYLVGLDRLRDPVVQAGLHDSAINVLKRRLSINPARLDEIKAAEEVQAVRMLSTVQDGIETSLQRTMVNITQEGLNRTEAVKRLRGAFERNGIVPENSFQIESIFRTQTNFAYSAGAWDAAQDPVVDEILWGYKIVTVGDDRVRDGHVGLDGMTAPKDDSIWQTHWTPLGFSCRCQILFIFEPREISLPEIKIIDGFPVAPGPDKGFDFNPGTILNPSGIAPVTV